jgi:hypothetical protein
MPEDLNQPKSEDIHERPGSENLKNSDSELIPDEILEQIPEEERGKVVNIVKQSMFSAVMRKSNPLLDKINSDHITKILDNSDEQDKRDRKEGNIQKLYNLALICLGLGFVVFIIVFLQRDQELLIKVMIAMISFLGGFGLGKALKKK